MKINRIFNKIGFLLLFFQCFFVEWHAFADETGQGTGSGSDAPFMELSKAKEDGFPLYFPVERDMLLRLAARLKETDEATLARQSFGITGFLPLSRQSRSFRGKVIQIKGRLLKTSYLPVLPSGAESDKTKTDAPSTVDGFYESWILLDDNKEIPVRLWTLAIPDRALLEPANEAGRLYRTETVTAQGVYYRLTSYNDGTDFRNTPMIVAPTFAVLKSDRPAANANSADHRVFSRTMKTLALVVVLLIWLGLRRWGKRRRERIAATLGVLALTSVFGSIATADEPTPDDVFPMLWRLSQIARPDALWNRLPSERLDAWKNGTPILPGIDEIGQTSGAGKTARTGQTGKTGQADDAITGYPFRGALKSVTALSLSETQKRLYSGKEYYRCVVETTGEPKREIVVYTLTLPTFAINVRGRTFDPKTIAEPAPLAFPRGINEPVGGIGFLLPKTGRVRDRIVLAAAEFGWYPKDTFAPLDEVNVALLETVPVFSPQVVGLLDRPEYKEKIPCDVRREILASLRMTKNDREPFYAMLAAGDRIGDTLFERPAARSATDEPKQSHWAIVELFNRPHLYQCRPVVIAGRARRVERVPIGDEEIRKRYGLDSYYQIYMYTPDSQGNPITVCVARLPEGMPVGSDDQYNETLEIAAFFYKSWAYRVGMTKAEKSGISEQTGTTETSHDTETPDASWIKSPLLVGGAVRWFPDASDKAPVSVPVRGTTIAFFVLLFAYIMYRLIRKRG